jgi:zearalenone synthase (highly reducing iterative type I polyketide synthase)
VEFGQTGLPLLSGFSASTIDSPLNYTVASASGEWLKEAEGNLKDSGLSPQFTLLDAGKDLSGSGFDIAMSALSSADSNELDTVLKQLSGIAKPGARVLLIDDLARESVDRHSVLLKHGLHVDFTTTASQPTLTVASVPAADGNGIVTEEIIILEPAIPSSVSDAVATQIAAQLDAASIYSKRITLQAPLADLKGKRCISLIEAESSFLENLSESGFASLKTVLLETSSLVWFVGVDGPAASLIAGLARTARNEIAGLQLCTLQAPPSSFGSYENLASAISRVATSPIRDNELRIENGILQLSRLLEDHGLSGAIDGLQRGEKVLTPLSQTIRPQKLVVQNPGLLDSLCFELDESLEGDIADGEVEIEVRASGVK